MNILNLSVFYLVFSPLLMAAVSAVKAFSSRKEKSMNLINLLVKIQSVVAILVTAVLSFYILKTGDTIVDPGLKWFRVDGLGISLEFYLDTLSISFLLLTVFISSVTAWFSTDYIFKERWYFKFFFHFYLMQSGLFLIILSGNFALFVCGWELLGLTSVFLIAFYQERRWPAINGIRAFITYRFCDFFLLLAILYLHKSIENFSFIQLVLGLQPYAGITTAVSVFFVIAAMGKSAQYPFSGWLPRAMEGPTPSSAVFYGALSVHAGIYLLLRVYPVIEHSFTARVLLVVIGTLTALQGSLVGSIQVDAKNTLAYATMGQLGIIFIELGLGYNNLAVFHSTSHALIRTYQFLRTPSMLLVFHHMERYNRNMFAGTEHNHQRLIPNVITRTLYRMALDEGYLENIINIPLSIFYRLSALTMKVHVFLTKRIILKGSSMVILFGAVSYSSHLQHATDNLILLNLLLLITALYFSLIAFNTSACKELGIYISISYLLLGLVPLFCLDSNLIFSGVLNFLSIVFSLSTVLYILGLIDKRMGEKSINDFLGIGISAPVMGVLFFLFSLSLAGMPGFFSFLFNEVFLVKLFDYSALIAGLYIGISILNSIIMLSTGFKLFYGQSHDRGPIDLNRNEICFGIILAIPLLIFYIRA